MVNYRRMLQAKARTIPFKRSKVPAAIVPLEFALRDNLFSERARICLSYSYVERRYNSYNLG
jgi:hypothetical protein